jgi:DNA-binding transcriptional MerR regulator
MKQRYPVQEVARMLGMSRDTLRYYDKIGLVKPVREGNRYRMYSPDELIDLMNIQIMRYAGFTLEEIKGKIGFRKMERVDPEACAEAAAFLEAKDAEIRRKIEHLENVSRLLRLAAATMRNYSPERDAQLAAYVRELYRDIRAGGRPHEEEVCERHED